MIAIESTIEQLVGQHERGLITDSEVVNSFLLELGNTDRVSEVAELIGGLPENLAQAVRRQLVSLKDADFNWRPFLIGEGLSEEELKKLREQLRLMHDHLEG